MRSKEALDIVTEALEQPDNSVTFKHTGLNVIKKALEKLAEQDTKVKQLEKDIIYYRNLNNKLLSDIEKLRKTKSEDLSLDDLIGNLPNRKYYGIKMEQVYEEFPYTTPSGRELVERIPTFKKYNLVEYESYILYVEKGNEHYKCDFGFEFYKDREVYQDSRSFTIYNRSEDVPENKRRNFWNLHFNSEEEALKYIKTHLLQEGDLILDKEVFEYD